MKSALLKLSLLLIFSLSRTFVFSQKEANTWRFENGLGIDFNQCPPKALYDGANGVWENACAISDPVSGQLLFYSNTVNVFNRNHKVMLNGANLLGSVTGASSTQVTIVPHPNKDSSYLYFVFTVYPQNKSTKDSMKYHVVDMRGDGGLGAVVRRGIRLLQGPLNEKLVAIRAPDKKSFWVITHGNMNNFFYAFKVGQQGVVLNPVQTSIGKVNSTVSNTAQESIGSLIASPDGSKLCYLNMCDKEIQLYRFDFSSGSLSNYLNIKTPNPLNPSNSTSIYGGFYGGSFSPNSNLLYVTTMGSNYTDEVSEIYQFDVSVWNQSDIENSVYTVMHMVPEYDNSIKKYTSFKHMKLGPDGKLYIGVSNYYTPYGQLGDPHSVSLCLPAIMEPDKKGSACDFHRCYINYNPASVGSKYTNFTVLTGVFQTWSLNNLYEFDQFPKNGRSIGQKQEVNCQSITLKPITKNDVKDRYILWSDGSKDSVLKIVKRPKYYWVETASPGCDTIRDSFEMAARKFVEGKVLDTCLGNGITLSPLSDTSGVSSYKWSNNLSTPSIYVNKANIYRLALLSNCDSTEDRYIVKEPLRKKGLSQNDCYRNGKWLYPLSSVSGLKNRLWNNGNTADSMNIQTPGIYWVDQISDCDTIRDSFIVTSPMRSKGTLTELCIGKGKTLIAASDSGSPRSYLWNNGNISKSISVNLPGIYWVDRISACDTTRDSFDVKGRAAAKGLKTKLCLGDEQSLWPLSDTLNHQGIIWSDGSSELPFRTKSPGNYRVRIDFECEYVTDTLELTARESISGSRKHFCPGQVLSPLTKPFSGSRYSWNNGSKDTFIIADHAGTYWLELISDCYSRRDSFDVSTLRGTGLFEARDTSFCGKSVWYLLNTDTTANNIHWKHGSTGALTELNKAGNYPFRITSKDLCQWDSGSVNVSKTANRPAFIEAAFTPNKNGINDVFPRKDLMTQINVEEITIYNRWGEVIYYSTELPWDGNFKGEICQDGVYYYRLLYRNCDYILRNWSGTLTLLR